MSFRGDYYTWTMPVSTPCPSENRRSSWPRTSPRRRSSPAGSATDSARRRRIASVVEEFRRSGGEGKPCYGMVHVCFAQDEATARRTAHEWWPNAAIGGDLGRSCRGLATSSRRRRWSARTTSRSRWPAGPTRSPPRGDQELRRRGFRPRLHPPGGARPGVVPRFLRARAAAGARSRAPARCLTRTARTRVASASPSCHCWACGAQMVDSTRSALTGASLAALGHEAGAQARLDASASPGLAKRTGPV